MAQIHSSKATLRISGDDLDPQEISSLLGYKSNLIQAKGEVLIGKNTGKKRIAKTGMWRIQANEREPENIDNQIVEILSRLSSDLSVWELIADKHYLDLFCGLFMDVSNEGMEISSSSLLLLAERQILLSLDIYAPDDGGPSRDDICPCKSGNKYKNCCGKTKNA